MSEGERKKLYEIKEEVLDILLSVDDKSAEGREIRERRDRYLSTLHDINHYAGNLKSILDTLEIESGRTKSLHGKLAVNEQEIAVLKNEIPLLKKEWKEIENPDRILEEYERQELLLTELAKKEAASGEDIFQTEKQLSEDLKTTADTAAELKTIIPEIEQKIPQKTALTEEVGRLDISAKIFVERDRLINEFERHEDELKVRSDALNKLEETIAECNGSIPELKAAIKTLQDRIGPLEEAAREVAALLEERKALQSDIEGLEPEHTAISADVEAIQREFESKNKVLKELEQENMNMKESITAVEAAIDLASATVMEIKVAKGKLQESTVLNEQTITELKEQLRAKMLMDKDISIIEESMKTILEAVNART